MPTETPVSPRAARTRTALLAAGLDLLAQKPIDAIPIDEVVAAAGVAKGSFFNHFVDKHAFAAALAAQVRMQLEERVGRANAGLADPVARIAGGMRECARFAIDEPKRTVVLLRSAPGTTDRTHPLNQGVAEDFDAACRLGLLHPQARDSGVLYWLGLCQALMANLVERPRSAGDVANRVSGIMLLGLLGLGVAPDHAQALAAEGGTAAAS